MIPLETAVHVVRAAGALHFAQVPGMIFTMRQLRLQRHLGTLPPLMRYMVFAMAGGIVLCVLGTGACVTLFPRDVATTRLGWSLCCFGALFWGYRSAIQIAIYARHWPTDSTLAHWVLSALFPVKTVLYVVCVVWLRSAVE